MEYYYPAIIKTVFKKQKICYNVVNKNFTNYLFGGIM